MTLLVKKYADHIGMAASGLCLVHCLLMPFIMAFWLQADHCAPGAGCCEDGAGFNYDYLFLALSAVAVWLASGNCQKPWVKAMMLGCFALFTASILLEPFQDGMHLLAYPAAIGLMLSHVFNWWYCKECNAQSI